MSAGDHFSEVHHSNAKLFVEYRVTAAGIDNFKQLHAKSAALYQSGIVLPASTPLASCMQIATGTESMPEMSKRCLAKYLCACQEFLRKDTDQQNFLKVLHRVEDSKVTTKSFRNNKNNQTTRIREQYGIVGNVEVALLPGETTCLSSRGKQAYAVKEPPHAHFSASSLMQYADRE